MLSDDCGLFDADGGDKFPCPSSISRTQNHRNVGVGGDLWRSSSPTFAKVGSLQ